MKKKLIACLLVAAMTLGLAACGSTGNNNNTGGGTETGGDSTTDGPTVSGEYEETTVSDSDIVYHKATDLTEDEITLTFINYMDEDTVSYLADRFMEIYPNITVKVSPGGDDFNQTITSLIQAGETPDVIMFTDCDTALSNQWLYDMTSLWESDPETDELPDTVTDSDTGMGTFSTGHRYASPAKFYPGIMYADRNVLATLNVEVPDNSWTWSEMIDIIKSCTKTVGGEVYYGLGYYNRLDSYGGIASGQEYIGEFGFNGTEFDLSQWAIYEQEFAELKQNGYIAPLQSSQEMEDWMGDWDAWCGSTERVALFSEAFWTFQNIWNTEAYLETYNLDIIPLVIPAVSEEDASTLHHSIATVDMGGIMATCEYPREAYELMKFMFWGRDGWLTKIELYASGATTSDGSTLLKNSDMTCPITTNTEVWEAYKEMFCEGMDEEHVQLWDEYFESCMSPISFGWETIAGYWNACDQYFNAITSGNYTGIHNIVDYGVGKAADYKDEGTKKFNYYHATAMLEYFGPDGYNILSDEEVELYEQMVADNTTT